MINIIKFEEFLNEASRKEIINQFNLEYQELYNKLALKADDVTLNKIKGRLFASRKYINALGLKDDILRADNLHDLFKIFDFINQNRQKVDANNVSVEVSPEEKVVQLFPRKFQDTIQNIIEKENPNLDDLKELSNKINNNILAIEQQGRDKEIIAVKSVEEIDDILQRVKLVSTANKWADLVPSKYRAEVKNRLEEFADIIADFLNYDAYKNVFLKKSITYDNADEFFSALKNFIISTKDSYDTIIHKINSIEGAEVEHSDENYIIAWIYSREASVELGSTQWCISYKNTSSYFKSYVYINMNKQYFIWDFTKDSTHNEYKVGVTINSDTGEPRNCHLVNDSSCLTNVKSYDWYKFLYPLTDSQFIKFYKFMIEYNVEVNDHNKIIKAAILNNDFDVFKNIVNSKLKSFKHDDIINVMKLLIDHDLLDFIKYIVLKHSDVFTGIGTLLVYAYDNNKKEIFNYLKSLFTPELLNILKKFAKTNDAIKQKLDYYNKTL